MAYPVGQVLSAPIVNGSPNDLFGTHIDYLGVGGYRSVPTLSDRDAIPTKPQLEYDGLGSGMRRNLMLVSVQETLVTYILYIPTYQTLSNDVDRLAALRDNNNWITLQDFLSSQSGQMLSKDQIEAIKAANSPSAINAFITQQDLDNAIAAVSGGAIDESNLVHKTGNEVIPGYKDFPNGLSTEVVNIRGHKAVSNFIGTYGLDCIQVGEQNIFTLKLQAAETMELYASNFRFLTGTNRGFRADNTGSLYVDGAVYAPGFVGDGSQLTNLPVFKYTAGDNIDITNNVITAVGIVNKVDKFVIDGVAYPSMLDATQDLYANATLSVRGDVSEQLVYPTLSYSTIDANSAVLSSSSALSIGESTNSTSPFTLNIIGCSFLGRVGVNSNASTTKNRLVIRDAGISGSPNFTFNTENIPANNIIDEIEFIRLKGVKDSSIDGVSLFRFLGNTYNNDRPLKIIFTDCDIESTVGNLFSGFTPRGTKIYLRGTTKIKGLSGNNLVSGLRTLDNGPIQAGNPSTQYTQAEIVVDERPIQAASISIAQFPEFTATSTGVQNIMLATGAKGVLTVQVSEVNTGIIRTVYLGNCTVANDMLTISANAKINVGDKIIGNYYK